MSGEEVVDFSFGLIAYVAVTFLNATDQRLGVARYTLEIVVSQLAPLRFHGAFHLVPLAFEHISVHGYVLSIRGDNLQRVCPNRR
jgi:hypothetical protein